MALNPEQRSWKWTPLRRRSRAPRLNPFQDPAAFWRVIAQMATIVMAVIIFGAFLYLARAIIVPLLSALVVSLTLGPLAGYASRRGLPSWVPALVIVTVLAVGLYLAIVVLSDPLSALISRSSEIGGVIKERLQFLDRPIAALHELQRAISGKDSGLQVDVNQANVLESVVTIVTPAAAEFILFFATLFFFLFSRSTVRRYSVNIFPSREGRLRALRIINDVENSLSDYLITVTAINFCVGIVIVVVTWLVGLPTPFLWGALAFILNYIPYIGPGIMHVGLFVIGLLTFPTLLPALIAPGFFLIFTFLEGHAITPAVVGRRMSQHPLGVFLSLVFWTWLWGPVGAFLATPILIMAKVTLDHLYPGDRNTLPG